MNVLLGVESLQGPLTGIGYYTKHLALGLKRHERVTNLKLYAHGRILSASAVRRNAEQDAAPKRGEAYLSKLRALVARSRLAVDLYERLIFLAAKRNLERYADAHILHSPNFFLPEFPGRAVVTFHDLSTVVTPQYHPGARVSFTNRAMERASKRAAHIITDSEFIRRQVIRHFGIAEDRCTAIPLGATADFRPRTAQECAPTLEAHALQFKRFCLFVSTIEPRKNLRRVLLAYADCARRGTAPFPLVIVGHPGWRSDGEHRMMRALERKGMVRYLGYQPYATLPVLFSAARFLVFPSLYEGFGLPVLESMQSGTAVITSEASSMHEICGAAALTVQPESVEEISQALELLSNDQRRVDELGRLGLMRAAGYSWSRCANETVAVYQSLR